MSRTPIANIASVLVACDTYMRRNPNVFFTGEGRNLNRLIGEALAENSERNADMRELLNQLKELKGVSDLIGWDLDSLNEFIKENHILRKKNKSLINELEWIQTHVCTKDSEIYSRIESLINEVNK